MKGNAETGTSPISAFLRAIVSHGDSMHAGAVHVPETSGECYFIFFKIFKGRQ